MSILDTFRLDGKVALVSGASSGLGVTFAIALAQAGADVAIAARRTSRLEQTAQKVRETGQRAQSITLDVSDPDACRQAVDVTVETFGRLDILINNAGIGTAVPALRETPEQFRQVIDTNLNGSYWLAQAAARAMQPGSSIINIASILALTTAGLPQAAYTASKAAIIGLTRDLAQQWSGREGIRVNAIAPGYVTTEMTSVYDEPALQSLKDRTILGRLGEPEEIATAAVYLAAPASAYITGQTIIIDGGFTLT